LYKNLQAEFLIKGAEANQNFILKCGSKTAPVRYLNGCVYFIKKDGMFAFSIKPKNAEQAFAMEALLNPEIQLVTIQGSAGTGKTLLSLASAFEQIKTKKNIEKNPDRPTGFYKKIYYSRKIVSVGDKDLGFLPGDAKNKVDPYMGGMNDNIECLKDVSARNSEAIDKAILNEVFKVEILNYIRGRSINNVIFIIDEAQNLTSHDIKTIISRAGEGTKIILIGDIHQIDLKNLDKWSNGLSHTIVKIRNHKRCAHIRLVKGERSELADMANLL
jgi:PhoH-like ATPase